MTDFDSILIVSFGGPEGSDDVMPFLRNVVKGKNVPDERLRAVAHHYELFGGISPINEQNRQLISALRTELDSHGIKLPIYWGNRNWHPMLTDTLKEMKDAGLKRSVAFVTSAYSSYSGCRQYREDIERSRAEVGEGAPLVDKVSVYYDRPGFLEANEQHLRQALAGINPSEIEDVHVLFTAHSIPISMAKGCSYESQLMQVAKSLSERTGVRNWKLTFQSRSGSPSIPWLEPDINDYIRLLHERGVKNIVVAPIGFVSDHMEIVYDLDTEAAKLCADLGINMIRSKTVGTHPAFVSTIRELIAETMIKRLNAEMGDDISEIEPCGIDCCIYLPEPASRPDHKLAPSQA